MTGAYVFDDTARDAELDRLRAIEAAFDPETHALLLATGLGAGWRCVEVGAGAGSIARWLGERVGEIGRVVAVDMNARFLADLRAPNVELVEADIRTAAIERAAADLVHARFVLIHQADPATVLDAMIRCLRPGGWLVLEEPDFSAATALGGDEAGRTAFANVNRAIEAMFARRGMDHAYGERLRGLLEERGFEQITVDASAPVDRGGGAIARMMAMSTRALADKYLATGLATSADIEGYVAFAADPASSATYHGTVRGAGRKPVGQAGSAG